jgi:DNA-directed RNA polymerase alpha subunit
MTTQQFTFTFSSIRQVTEFAEAWLNGAKDLPRPAPQKHRIEEAPISVRTANCLRAEGFVYMEDALEFGRVKLGRIETIGQKTLNEIDGWAKQFNMWWKP